MNTTGDDDFVLVDENNEPIPANAEASALMAAELGNELEVHDTDEWYLVGMEEARELTDRLDAFIAASSTASEGRLPEKSTMCAADKSQGPSTTENEDPEDDDGGMEECFSREYSDQSDEWVLEDILKRRVCKDGPSPHEYLCKWKWYREPTWEPRVGIEELGYVRQLDEFDAVRNSVTRPLLRAVAASPPEDSSLLELLGQRFFSKVKSAFHRDNLEITHFALADRNRALEREFIQRWKATSATHCPMLVFHGTRAANILSIAYRGFIVPGFGGVTVENGSAFGTGIYAAKDPGYSSCYAPDNKMFACVALVGPLYQTVKQHGNICVFFEPCLIVPLYLIGFRYAYTWEGDEVVMVPSPKSVPPVALSLEVLVSLDLNNTYGDGDGEPQSSIPFCRAVPFQGAHSSEESSRKGQVKLFSKKMMKQLPRKVKEYYRHGELCGKK